MGEKVQKILFVNSEIFPYLPENGISSIGRYLPQGIQEMKCEIRSFMPRYGCVNERKNQLHEVIRLSGMNLIIDEVDHPLIIKVASISSAHIQVYFIDNEDYFHRKGLYFSEDGKFFPDNDQRAIFFARGVLETVKKLRWAPDIIHCQGWMSHLLPVYLNPIFASSKVVLSLYNDTPKEKFSDAFCTNAVFGGATEEDFALLRTPTGINLAETAIKYSDGIIIGSGDVEEEILAACGKSGLPVLPFDAESIADGSYVGKYHSFYEKI